MLKNNFYQDFYLLQLMASWTHQVGYLKSNNYVQTSGGTYDFYNILFM